MVKINSIMNHVVYWQMRQAFLLLLGFCLGISFTCAGMKLIHLSRDSVYLILFKNTTRFYNVFERQRHVEKGGKGIANKCKRGYGIHWTLS